MDKQINKQNYHPTGDSEDNKFTIKNQDFIKDKQKFKTYFGPYQKPSDVDAREYVKPTDWPKSGSALRVPQMIWLSSVYTDVDLNNYTHLNAYGTTLVLNFTVPVPGIGQDLYFFYSNGHLSIVHYAWHDPPATMGPQDPPYIYITESSPGAFGINGPDTPANIIPLPDAAHNLSTVPNLYAQQYPRIKDTFNQVKERIETLRPNRTWVLYNDYSQFGDPFVPIGSRQSPMIIPDPSEDFFGTNFLHIHAGTSSDAGSSFGESGFYIPSVGESYNDAKTQILGSWKKFAGYRVMVYGPEGNFGLDSLNVYLRYIAPPPVPDNAYGVSGPIPQWSQENVDIWNANAQQSIVTRNAIWTIRQDNTRKFLKDMCTDLSNYGFTYEGDTGILSVDYLVAKIADYYGFDPSTGKDL